MLDVIRNILQFNSYPRRYSAAGKETCICALKNEELIMKEQMFNTLFLVISVIDLHNE